MDELIDQFFSPSSWTDDNVSETSSWIGNGLDQTNEILVDTMGAYAGDEKNLPACLVPSCHIVDSLIAEDTSMFVGGDSGFDVDKSLIPGESQALQGGMDYGSKPTYVMDGDVKPGYRDQQLITLDYDSPELVPVAIDPTKSPSVQPESGSVGSNDSEPSESHPTPRDSDSLTSIPPLWPLSSYRSVSSLPPVAVQDKVQGLGLQGQYVQTDAAVLGNNFMDDINLQCNLPALLSGQHDLNNHYLSSFAAGHLIPVGRTSGIHPQMQLSEGNSIKHYADQSPISQQLHMPATAAGGCNGTAKPRVRARRGQATDPHSIAERLRREKIAERMKNLQELVPNSNKTDKASMLDEIIEYVKFLQLQVKVLSMSRLGAAGAVVPLITDSHAEGSTGLFLPQSGSRGVDSFESPDDLEFEQEVVKLMESSMTTAIQFLQSKGLCLMPLALASAISGSKASSGPMSADRKKPVLSNGNGQASVETGQVPSDGDTKSKENVNREDIPINRCNGDHIKQKEVMNTARNTREMNPHEA